MNLTLFQRGNFRRASKASKMGIDELRGRFSIGARFTSGTATPVTFASVIPQERSELEVFWTRCLLHKLRDELECTKVRVTPNEDDSHGKHDVIVQFKDGPTLGVQVTEMTQELQRKRASMRQGFTEKVLDGMREAGIESEQKVTVSLKFSALEHKKLKLPEPLTVVSLFQEELGKGVQQRLVETSFGSIFIVPVEGGEIFLPRVGNIGIDVGIDLLPRSVDTYVEAVEYLAEKKSNSVSPWLLIWSVSFWQDKHWLGDALIQHMKDVFSKSSFQNVFFLESMDGEGMFQANLTLHKIKGEAPLSFEG